VTAGTAAGPGHEPPSAAGVTASPAAPGLDVVPSRVTDLWNSDEPPPLPYPSKRKTIDHPAVGRLTLDCDTLVVALDDLRITVYTAEPGTEDAERLALAVVLGTQSLGV
jgi:hypothetical protein